MMGRDPPKPRASEQGTFVPAPIDELHARQLQRIAINTILNESKAAIDTQVREAKRQKTFTVRFDGDLSGHILSETRMADIIRAWTWETYKGTVGFQKHVVFNGQSQITFCLE